MTLNTSRSLITCPGSIDRPPTEDIVTPLLHATVIDVARIKIKPIRGRLGRARDSSWAALCSRYVQSWGISHLMGRLAAEAAACHRRVPRPLPSPRLPRPRYAPPQKTSVDGKGDENQAPLVVLKQSTVIGRYWYAFRGERCVGVRACFIYSSFIRRRLTDYWYLYTK